MWQISLFFILIQKYLAITRWGCRFTINRSGKAETLRYQLTRILISHGYEFISPPMIEYTESLLGYASEDVKLQTFKIIDQLTGRLMGYAQISPHKLRGLMRVYTIIKTLVTHQNQFPAIVMQGM